MSVSTRLSAQSAIASTAVVERSTAGELSLLGAHFARCNGCKSRWYSIRCALDVLDAFVAPRLVTTVFVIGAVVGIGSLVL